MRLFPALLLPLVVPTLLTAQVPGDRGAFVTRLGVDTVAVETFTRTATTLSGDRLLRSPRVSLLHYEATLGRDGRIIRLEASSRPGNRLDLPPLQSSVVEIGTDSATVTLKQGDSTRAYRLAVRPGAVPMFNTVNALYGQMTRQLAAARLDSMDVDQIFPGVLTAQPTYVARAGRDTMAIGYFGSPIHARVDARGDLLGLQGSLTTVKVLVTREPDVNLMGIARSFAAAELQTGPAGQMSPRDTARGTVAGATIWVDYGRPHVRGRKIFGGIVPFGEVWRTGANAATQLSTDRPLVFGSDTVPAGLYTLWSLPTESGAELIFNHQTGQWGTDHDPAQDFLKVPLVQSALDTPVEAFTISVRPDAGQGGTLVFEWDRTRWEVPFSTVR